MKTEPTELDRKTALHFTPAPGMRVWRAITPDTLSEPGVVLEVDPQSAGIRTDSGWSWFSIAAIDTDDPATVGVMLAQIEEVDGTLVDLFWNLRTSGRIEYVAQWRRVNGDARYCLGPTRGAALVAAMRVIRFTST